MAADYGRDRRTLLQELEGPYMEQARGRSRPRARCFDRAARITCKPDRPPKIGFRTAIPEATVMPTRERHAREEFQRVVARREEVTDANLLG